RVEGNLAIAEAPTPEERPRVHAERAESLTRALDDPRLAAEDRRLAEKLLETGGRLAREDDLLGQADHLDEMTDVLVEHLHLAADRGNGVRVKQLAKQFQRVAERGVTSQLDGA